MRFKLFSLLTVASLALLPHLRAANQANDSAANYTNPWGPANPQSNPATGFTPWDFDHWNPPTQSPVKPLYFIDTASKAWAINVPADIQGQPGYDGVYVGFTGDGHLDANQTFSTVVTFTDPGPQGPTENPTEGIDFFAEDPGVPGNYPFGGSTNRHQVLGIYLGSGPTFYLAVHNTLSDENPAVWTKIGIPSSAFSSTDKSLQVYLTFTQQAGGNWSLNLSYLGHYTLTFYYPVWNPSWTGGYWSWVPYTQTFTYWNFVALNSGQYGTTWNTAPTQGLNTVRYFCSQGGATPGGPLSWKKMSVSAPTLPQ